MKINDFVTHMDSLGVSKEHLYIEEDESSQMVSFSEYISDEQLLFISLAFPKKEGMIEIYIRKELDCTLTYETLLKLNQLNMEYTGVVFFATQGALVLKFAIQQDCTIDDVLAKIALTIPVAEKELAAI